MRRLQQEVEGYTVELGADGRLVRLQLQELVLGLAELTRHLERDFQPRVDRINLAALAGLDADDLASPLLTALACGLIGPGDDVDARMQSRGHRQLAMIGRLPTRVAEALVERFGTLQDLFGASTSDLVGVNGVDYAMARTVREGLARLAESAYAERLD
jgi:diadenylate cyclase